MEGDDAGRKREVVCVSFEQQLTSVRDDEKATTAEQLVRE